MEELSVSKAVETLEQMLLPTKEAAQVFFNLEQLKEAVTLNSKRQVAKLPDNITETPKFHKAKSQSVELSDSTKETFARIGARAREAFIEEQIERANLYNISYENYGDDYYSLMQDIDKYEYLLEKAKEYCVEWDNSEYDPMALEQAIENARSRYWEETREMRSDYFYSRRVGV